LRLLGLIAEASEARTALAIAKRNNHRALLAARRGGATDVELAHAFVTTAERVRRELERHRAGECDCLPASSRLRRIVAAVGDDAGGLARVSVLPAGGALVARCHECKSSPVAGVHKPAGFGGCVISRCGCSAIVGSPAVSDPRKRVAA
jgi:hypothetical protein